MIKPVRSWREMFVLYFFVLFISSSFNSVVYMWMYVCAVNVAFLLAVELFTKLRHPK